MESDCRPVHVVQSLCKPAVFNAVISRSKCHVIAVGNPLVLFVCEATMDRPMWCWRKFIDNCIENCTFIVPKFLSDMFSHCESTFNDLRMSQSCNGK